MVPVLNCSNAALITSNAASMTVMMYWNIVDVQSRLPLAELDSEVPVGWLDRVSEVLVFWLRLLDDVG